MSKIAVVGSGYVGLVSGAVFSDFGHNVVCVDVDENKINALKGGVVPIYEPGLDKIIENNVKEGRLSFTTDIKTAVEENDVLFIAVGTPPKDDGGADMKYVRAVARSIAENMNGYKLIVDKSTVPIGTGAKLKDFVRSILDERGVDFPFDIVSNPEFLREGTAIADFYHPDRVVIGAESQQAIDKMREIYHYLRYNGIPMLETDITTAEMIKYASNAFLALKITYINEVANLCEGLGADVEDVARALGLDHRISPYFLNAGPGYGGSCFPKDTKALAQIARKHGENLSLIDATIAANEVQKHRMARKVKEAMGDLEGKTVAVLGVTFKPDTDDMREAPSLVILPELAEAGATIRIYDPQGEKEGVWRFAPIQDQIVFCSDAYEAVRDADAVVLLTEWEEFRSLDLKHVSLLMRGNFFFDLRNVFPKDAMEGFRYYSVGR